MLQDVLSLKPPNEIIDEAARFFTQRRIKVIARSKNSLRFALSAAHAAEAGQVKAVRDTTGQTRVSVETGGLSVWHIAESYLRDLRSRPVAGHGRGGAAAPPARRGSRASHSTRWAAPSAWSHPDHSGRRHSSPLPAVPLPRPPRPRRRSRTPPWRSMTSLHRHHRPGWEIAKSDEGLAPLWSPRCGGGTVHPLPRRNGGGLGWGLPPTTDWAPRVPRLWPSRP